LGYTRSGEPCTLGARRYARRHSGRAARPCAGELPVRRRRPLTSLGCEQEGHLRALPRDGKPCQKPAHGGGADGATRSARRRGTATPRLRRPSGGAACLGPRAGVRSTLGFRPPNPAGRLRHGSKAGRSELRARRVASLWHGGASRGFSPALHKGVRRDARTRSARPLAWGSRGATPPLSTLSQHRDHVALRTATAALRSTNGPGAPSVAARQFCGSKASTQARNQQRCVSSLG
jgi:hypothetical protein